MKIKECISKIVDSGYIVYITLDDGSQYTYAIPFCGSDPSAQTYSMVSRLLKNGKMPHDDMKIKLNGHRYNLLSLQ